MWSVCCAVGAAGRRPCHCGLDPQSQPAPGEAPKNLVILGSTGSIGQQTIDVVRQNPGRLRVVALATHRNIQLLAAQAAEFSVKLLAIGDESLATSPLLSQLPSDAIVGFGAAAVNELVAAADADVVLNALVGAAGLRASYATLALGRRLALANKESLVVGGDLIMPLARKAVGDGGEGGAAAAETGAAAVTAKADAAAASAAAASGAAAELLLPVDSEHSAIFQCLVGEDGAEVSRLWLTASGGPFRGWKREALKQVDVSQALAHPTWNMGQKISIDSATLMNKGLEYIEAHHLFAIEYSKITVVVHPQSCVHSMVEYCDGSVKAHLGVTDMRIPIQYALSFPARWQAPLPTLDFRQLGSLTFEPPDLETFGTLKLAMAVGQEGGTLPAAMNAANEMAVSAFLNGRCGFLDIESCIAQVCEQHQTTKVESLEQLEEVDSQSRQQAQAILSAL